MSFSIIPTLIYCAIVSSSYVQAIHVFAQIGDRNDPKTIKSRIIRISMVTAINLLLVSFTMKKILKIVPVTESILPILGIKNLFIWGNFIQVLKTLLLFMILFIGPVVDFIFNPHFYYESIIEAVRDLLFAPLTEEFFYTSIVTGSLLAYKISSSSNGLATGPYTPTVFRNDNSMEIFLKLSPLFFGFAHLHHGIELWRKNYKFTQIIFTCLFQFLYTSLFGYLTNKLFVNTGNVWCCFVAHAFCNFMGLPSLTVSGCKSYKILYWVLLFVGITQFGSRFNDLTL